RVCRAERSLASGTVNPLWAARHKPSCNHSASAAPLRGSKGGKINMNLNDWRRVLVFGAHIDDEIIGPGGTLARLSEAGAEVFVVTFTGGTKETGYARVDLKDTIADMRRAEAGAADAVLGIKERIFLGRPTQ